MKAKKEKDVLWNHVYQPMWASMKENDTLYGKKAGLQEMDKIVAIDSIPVQFYDEMSTILKNHKNGEVVLTVERNGQLLQLNVKSKW